MVISYKHIRITNNFTNDNIWVSCTQYYRTLLCAQSVHISSILPYSFTYSDNSHKISFKSRYLANIIGKFLYSFIQFVKIFKYFNKLYKKIVKNKYFTRSKSAHIYRKKEYLFTLKLKNILLLIKNKCFRQIKKRRHLLWQHFYLIPNNFWSTTKKKKIKYFIWSVINRTNTNRSNSLWRINKNKYSKYKRITFLSYNQLSSVIYSILNKKRKPRKEWILYSKRTRKRKKNFYLYMSSYNTYDRYYSNAISNKKFLFNLKKKKEDIYVSNNNKFKKNDISLEYKKVYYYFIINKLTNMNNNIYYYISLLCKFNINNIFTTSITHTIYTSKLTSNVLSNAFSTFNMKSWYSKFFIEHNANKYFHINSLFIYKTNICVNVYNSMLINKINNNNLFLLYINNNIKYDKNNIKVYNVQSNKNIKNRLNYLKFTRLQSNKHLFNDSLVKLKKRTRSIYFYYIYKRLTSKYINKLEISMHINNIYKRLLNINKFKNNVLFSPSSYLYKKDKLNYKVQRRHKKLLESVNNIKDIFNSLKKLNERSRVITNNNSTSILFNFFLYKQYKKKLNKIHTSSILNRFIKKKKNYNIKNNYLYKYKKIIKINKFKNTINVRKYLNINNDYVYILYKNKYIYNIYFDNLNIYKEIFTEYLIRLNNKSNNYDGYLVLNNRILFNIRKQYNTGNIINGIHVHTNIVKYSLKNKPSKIYNNLEYSIIYQYILPFISINKLLNN